MVAAMRALFEAIRLGRQSAPELYKRVRIHFAVKRARGRRCTALFAKALDLNHLDRAVERQRHHIANAHQLARRGDALAVEPHEACISERGGGAARAHHARVPEPFVDALAVQALGIFSALLKLLLEGGELGEGRIGIWRLVATLRTPAIGLGVILLAFGAIHALAAVATGRPVAALRAVLTLGALALALQTLLALVAVLTPIIRR